MEDDKQIPKEEVLSGLESQINQALYDLEHNYLPNLGHSQKERLLLAAMSYPLRVKAFTVEDDGENMVRAFSACKAVSDALVALGVETVIEQMVKNVTGQAELEKAAEGGANE